MKIESITLREIHMPLVHFFETSFGRIYDRRILLVTAQCDGVDGWGECVAGDAPLYSSEWFDAAWVTIQRHLAPMIVGHTLSAAREAVPLMERLLALGYTVLLESSGERPLENVPPQVIKIVDVKCPHSGEFGSFREENLAELTAQDEVKFVLSDRADYQFARDFTRQHALPPRVGSVIFSPAFRKDARGARDSSHCLLDPQQLAQWILEDGLEVRLGLQIHKLIWEPSMKGV